MAETPMIRFATKEDVGEIQAMIEELAGFENAMEHVKSNTELLSSTLTFAPCESDPSPKQGYARTLLLAFPSNPAIGTKEQVAGMALYFHNYSTWRGVPGIFLEDLFVRPAYRRRGYATLFLRRLAEEVIKVSDGKGRLEWNCLKWNEGALKFYHGDEVRAERMDEWVGLRVEGERLKMLSKTDR